MVLGDLTQDQDHSHGRGPGHGQGRVLLRGENRVRRRAHPGRGLLPRDLARGHTALIEKLPRGRGQGHVILETDTLAARQSLYFIRIVVDKLDSL